jgi:hypothetical protein
MPSLYVTWFEFDLHHRIARSHDRAIADEPLSNSERGRGRPTLLGVACMDGSGWSNIPIATDDTEQRRSRWHLP